MITFTKGVGFAAIALLVSISPAHAGNSLKTICDATPKSLYTKDRYFTDINFSDTWVDAPSEAGNGTGAVFIRLDQSGNWYGFFSEGRGYQYNVRSVLAEFANSAYLYHKKVDLCLVQTPKGGVLVGIEVTGDPA